MGEKLELEGKEYDLENISDTARNLLESLKFANSHLEEKARLLEHLKIVRKVITKNLKKEMLSDKAGLLFEDN